MHKCNKSLWNLFNAIFLFNSCYLVTLSHKNSNDSLINCFILLLFPRIDISRVNDVKGTPNLNSTLFNEFKNFCQILFSYCYKPHSSNTLSLNCELIESRKYSQYSHKVSHGKYLRGHQRGRAICKTTCICILQLLLYSLLCYPSKWCPCSHN